jgi:hypothetical protein
MFSSALCSCRLAERGFFDRWVSARGYRIPTKSFEAAALRRFHRRFAERGCRVVAR